jgi:hypothetical protein
MVRPNTKKEFSVLASLRKCVTWYLTDQWVSIFFIHQWNPRRRPMKVTMHSVHFWRSWNRTSLMYSFKYYQQDATFYNILYYCQCSTCFMRFLRPSSGAQNCTHNIWYMSSLLAATASVGEFQLTLAVAASKLDMYQMLCVQFWAPDDGRRNCLKHAEHWR